MIVNRMTHVVKRGRMDEAVALIKELGEKRGEQGRIFVCQYGATNRLAIELEAESLAELEKGWTEWLASPEAAPFYEKWYDLTETDVTNEIWRVVE